MPALPGKPSTRKGPTPRSKFHQEDVWEHTFKVIGLEPLSSNHDEPGIMATANSSSTPTPTPTAGLEQDLGRKKMTILDLPSETHKDIFKYVGTVCAAVIRVAPDLENTDSLISLVRPISTPSPWYRSISETLLQSNYIEAFILSSQTTMTLQTILPSMPWLAVWIPLSRVNMTTLST
jgi:hypothetical protein